MNPFYKDYSQYLDEIFPGIKVQKISVGTSTICPNRDGTLSDKGCIYCNNASFSPDYCREGLSISHQIEAGKSFFRRKYPKMKYLAYFQTYTSTYGVNLKTFKSQVEEALIDTDVLGIVIGTRPDCLSDEFISYLSNLTKTVFIELGAETSHDMTLKTINRGHDWDCVVQATKNAADAGLRVGLHLIAGLPDETDDMVIETVQKSCKLQIESLKLHQLQVIRNTPLHEMIKQGELQIKHYTANDYLDLCIRIVDKIPSHIAIERFIASSPPDLVITPHWGLKNHEFIDLLHNKLRNIRKV